MRQTSHALSVQLKHLPTKPGVYLMRDTEGNILYVGKAANLRNRVRSYFHASQKLTPKIERLVARVNNLDLCLTNSEQEALILECNFIKQYHPYYNVRLKDGKTYPYLKISLDEYWPRLYITRRLEDDGGRYFGPFASASSVRQTLKVLKGIFPFRSCSRAIDGKDPRPCLDYYIHHCLAPCVGKSSKREYDEVIRQIVLFLEGKQGAVIRGLQNQMKKAAENLDFEKAAMLRDQIQALNQVIEGQTVVTNARGEQDVIAFATENDRAYVQIFLVRSGKVVGRESFVLQGTASEEPEQIMASFIKQFYDSAPHVPSLLLLQYPVEDKSLIEDWLQGKRGSKVRIEVPSRGSKKQLVKIAEENAKQGLQQLKFKEQADDPSALPAALAEIERELHLSHSPQRIECYDISNIQGKTATGSMVVFEKGKPKTAHYRRFRIKTVSGADDYAMLQEVLRRRFKRSSISKSDDSGTDAWATVPDLVLIDGGKGQLNAAISAMQEVGVGSTPVASLAKENEEIFIPQRPKSIALSRTSPGLQLLQRLRDEAHRFAIGYHRRIRQKESFRSALDNVPGIGPKRKRALLRRFGSVRHIREASIEELAAVEGMTASSAQRVKELL